MLEAAAADSVAAGPEPVAGGEAITAAGAETVVAAAEAVRSASEALHLDLANLLPGEAVGALGEWIKQDTFLNK
jgi:hypothetical protein